MTEKSDEPASIYVNAVSDKEPYNPEEVARKIKERADRNRVLVLQAGTYISNKTLALLSGIGNPTYDFSKLLPLHPGGRDEMVKEAQAVEVTATKLAKRIAREIKGQIPDGWNVRFFTGTFAPSSDQERRIRDARQLKEFVITTLGEESDQFGPHIEDMPLESVARQVTLNPDIKFKKSWFSNDSVFDQVAKSSFISQDILEKASDELTIAQIRTLYDQLRELHPNIAESEGCKFMQFILDLAPYRTYDVSHELMRVQYEWHIWSEFVKQVAVPGVIPDVVGLFAKNEDSEAQQVIDGYIELTKGSFMGKRSLLDVSKYSQEQLKIVSDLYKYIEMGRVRYLVGEIKTKLYANERSGDEYVPTSRRISNRDKQSFERGLGYRLWGMFQQSLAVFQQTGNESLLRSVQSFGKGKKASLEQGRMIHKEIAPIMQKGNVVMLVVAQWPLFDHVQDDHGRWVTESSLRYKFDWSTKQYQGGDQTPHVSIPNFHIPLSEKLSPFEVFRHTRRAGRMILRKISDAARLRRLLNLEDQDPGADTVLAIRQVEDH